VGNGKHGRWWDSDQLRRSFEVTIDSEVFGKIQRLAETRGVSTETLINLWLQENAIRTPVPSLRKQLLQTDLSHDLFAREMVTLVTHFLLLIGGCGRHIGYCASLNMRIRSLVTGCDAK
jgi:hypothetical protein